MCGCCCHYETFLELLISEIPTLFSSVFCLILTTDCDAADMLSVNIHRVLRETDNQTFIPHLPVMLHAEEGSLEPVTPRCRSKPGAHAWQVK